VGTPGGSDFVDRAGSLTGEIDVRFIDILRLRLRSLFLRTRVERGLDEELEYHLERQIQEHIAAGFNEADARRAALRSIDRFEQRKEECRDMRGLNLVDNLLQDARFTMRQLRKSPAFASTAISTLALGMCASVSIFAFVDAALIKPLPYPHPSRLVGVYESVAMFPQSNLSYADYVDWKRLNNVFTSLAAYQTGGMTLSTSEGAERARGVRVSDDFFRTLGVTPILGRDFRPGEDSPAAARTVMLSHSTWQKRYGGQPGVLGQSVTLNGTPNLIIGVLPPEFHFAPAEPAEFWTALHATNPCDLRRSCHNMYGVARLADGVSVQTAAANMTSIAQQLERQYPDSNRGQGAAVLSLTEVIVGNLRPILLMLLTGAGLLLLIASVNVASLLVVRSASRRREIAVRTALGASAARVVRQFVTEGLVLVTAGSALGLILAYWATGFLPSLIPPNIAARMPFLHQLGLNARVAAFAAVLAGAAALLFAVTPLLHLSLSKSGEALAEGSRGSAGTTWRRFGSKLVVLELAIAMVLLVGAGLLGRSLSHLLNVDLGFRADHLATLSVAAPDTYATDPQTVALARQILNRVAVLPGVKSAAISSRPPLMQGNTMWIRVVGRPFNGEHNEVQYREVTAGYFTTLEARLRRGRYFSGQDDASTPPVVIINQALARQYFPDEIAVGTQLLYVSASSQTAMEIVGIVDDIKESALDTATPPTMYVAFDQDPTSGFTIAVRTWQGEQSLLPALTTAIHEIDPGISTFGGTDMTQAVNDSQAAYVRRSSAALVGGFAALAWVMVVVGLYGVVAYSVGQRTREIGVRMALGAGRSSVYRLILREAGRLITAGMMIGLACAVAAATVMRGLLFGVSSWDVPTLASVAAVLGLSALLASYIPARRAASVNPVDALRAE
jgi:macrolide transport system ATP-binding/permease protein